MPTEAKDFNSTHIRISSLLDISTPNDPQAICIIR